MQGITGACLDGKVGNREPGRSAQNAPKGSAEVRHPHRVGSSGIVGALVGLVGQGLCEHVDQVIPAAAFSG